MGYVNRHVYDVRCGCKDCTSYELELQALVESEEPQFLQTHRVTGQTIQYGKPNGFLPGSRQGFGSTGGGIH